MKITIPLVGVSLTALALAGGLYAYDENKETKEHQTITVQMVAGDVELDLQRVELELKLLRIIKERRPLTADELDRQAYLLDLRKILRAQQKRKVG